MFKEDFFEFIENKISLDDIGKKFFVIIGVSPSKNARSPILWNAAFKKHKKKFKMIPLDVKKKNIGKVINLLKKNPNFYGGAITNPYKEFIYKKFKKNADKITNQIKSVNCIYRKKKNFFVTNTDGEAALMSFKEKFKITRRNKILIMGFGGVGKSVAFYFNYEAKIKKSKLIVSTRYKNINQKKFKLINFINYKEINKNISKFNIIINCTDIGFDKKKNVCPIPERLIKKINKKAVIFDVIYNPIETKFLKISKKENLHTLNGEKMNLLQAALAFNYANNLNKNNIITKKALSYFKKK